MLLLTWQSGPEIRSTATRMEPAPQPDMAAVAALPPRTQDELLDAITHSIYNQPPTDWSKVSNLGLMRAVPEVKETVNLAQQYMQCGYDPQALIARLAEIVCHDNFTEMHAFKHHQSIVEEYYATREPWRWMHLVCGAQAAAISFGKNMAVYEESSRTAPRRLTRVGKPGGLRLPAYLFTPIDQTAYAASTAAFEPVWASVWPRRTKAVDRGPPSPVY